MKIRDLILKEVRKLNEASPQPPRPVPLDDPATFSTQPASQRARQVQVQQPGPLTPPYQYGAAPERSLDPFGYLSPAAPATPGAVPLLPTGVGMHGASQKRLGQMTQLSPAAQQAASKARRLAKLQQKTAPATDVTQTAVAPSDVEKIPPPVGFLGPKGTPEEPTVAPPRRKQDGKIPSLKEIIVQAILNQRSK